MAMPTIPKLSRTAYQNSRLKKRCKRFGDALFAESKGI
jgi:hypothetical protein